MDDKVKTTRQRVVWVAPRLFLALLFAWLLLLGALSYGYMRAFTHPPCPPPQVVPAGYQSVTLLSEDGLHLRGWWRPPQNGAVILLLGGNGASRDGMLLEAELLARHGYGSLALEYRSCAGAAATLGYREAGDVRRMAAFAQSQPGVQWLGALGFSAGGTAVILAAAEMPELRAVVAEGNNLDLWYELTHPAAPPLSVEWQVQRLVAGMYWLQTGVRPAVVSSIAALPRLAPRPVLIIAGELEAENNRSQQQAQAAGPNAQLWIVPGAGHGGYWQVGEEYGRRLLAFFDAARCKKNPCPSAGQGGE